jgi:hypothetical protein
MRRPYRKHFVLIKNQYIPVKDWYRDNMHLFQNINGIPTSEQIGTILINQGFTRTETETEVIYRK